MTILLITADLECCKCRVKIDKVLKCLTVEYCIEKVEYEYKKNTVVVHGKFDAEKLCCRIRCKAGKCIKDCKPKPEDPKPKPPPPTEKPKPPPCDCCCKPKPCPCPPPISCHCPPPKPCECPPPKPCHCCKPVEKPKPKPEEKPSKPEEKPSKPEEKPKPPPPKPEYKLVPYPYPFPYPMVCPSWPWQCPPQQPCHSCASPPPPPPCKPPTPPCGCPSQGSCGCGGKPPAIWPPPPWGAYPLVTEEPPSCSVM